MRLEQAVLEKEGNVKMEYQISMSLFLIANFTSSTLV